jgi:hypothetical protein
MNEAARSVLSAWESYYVIVGSSGAALIGLQFVVIALISETGNRPNSETLKAFGTPTIVHLGGALLVSGMMSAPWPSLLSAGVALGIGGLIGVAYAIITFIRARRQSGYTPVLEDWLWHNVLPFAAYASVTIGAFTLRLHAEWVLFLIGAAAMLLLFIGIHNAWDTVTYIVTDGPSESRSQIEAAAGAPAGKAVESPAPQP